MALVRLDNLVLNYGHTCAVNHFSTTIEKGEMVAVLGPSGCGKSSLLACIAGIVEPQQGEIWVGNNCFSSAKKHFSMSPQKRNIGFVFQNYALWPHMTVKKNISYPLRVRDYEKEEVEARVRKYLELLHLEGKAERYPAELSGGEQQRVALGRALIREPSLLVLDEPLSNIDTKLREHMMLDIREIQKKLQLTVIYVTHDQSEALSLADKLILMHQGSLIQQGSPQHIYDHPNGQFAAQFLGTNNIVPHSLLFGHSDSLHDEVWYAIRSEDITISTQPESESHSLGEGIIVDRMFMGAYIQYVVEVSSHLIKVRTARKYFYELFSEVFLRTSSFTPVTLQATS